MCYKIQNNGFILVLKPAAAAEKLSPQKSTFLLLLVHLKIYLESKSS